MGGFMIWVCLRIPVPPVTIGFPIVVKAISGGKIVH